MRISEHTESICLCTAAATAVAAALATLIALTTLTILWENAIKANLYDNATLLKESVVKTLQQTAKWSGIAAASFLAISCLGFAPSLCSK